MEQMIPMGKRGRQRDKERSGLAGQTELMIHMFGAASYAPSMTSRKKKKAVCSEDRNAICLNKVRVREKRLEMKCANKKSEGEVTKGKMGRAEIFS